ncbi:hypothetical protein BT67DRAFT_130890 [Trichocladium antarcticum]|uniref:Uncharacterized protein n=1 Tax=Trichocladium antarcticum TaxID=1450529 RepID=A0AAN6USC6_9PEZI|nr:hypothetical protein BT67DRAFT_130890 [Trichocladium antarcticum]
MYPYLSRYLSAVQAQANPGPTHPRSLECVNGFSYSRAVLACRLQQMTQSMRETAKWPADPAGRLHAQIRILLTKRNAMLLSGTFWLLLKRIPVIAQPLIREDPAFPTPVSSEAVEFHPEGCWEPWGPTSCCRPGTRAMIMKKTPGCISVWWSNRQKRMSSRDCSLLEVTSPKTLGPGDKCYVIKGGK